MAAWQLQQLKEKRKALEAAMGKTDSAENAEENGEQPEEQDQKEKTPEPPTKFKSRKNKGFEPDPHSTFNSSFYKTSSFRFKEQLPRHKNFDYMHSKVNKDDKQAMEKLPCYFHNATNRLALTNTLERSIREAKVATYKYLDPQSTLNTRKDFRINPNAPTQANRPMHGKSLSQPKKKATFN